MERTIKPHNSFGLQLCVALKLNPQKVKTINIKVQVDGDIVVTTEQILPVDERKEVLKMLNYYHLIENKPDGKN